MKVGFFGLGDQRALVVGAIARNGSGRHAFARQVDLTQPVATEVKLGQALKAVR